MADTVAVSHVRKWSFGRDMASCVGKRLMDAGSKANKELPEILSRGS